MFLFSLIPIAILAYLVGGYYLILAPGNLYNAIVSEDWNLFWNQITYYAAISTSVLLVKVIRGFLRETASNFMRKRLTTVLHRLYFAHPNHALAHGPSPYYQMLLQKNIDNPDQRIVADARDFATSFFNIVAGGQAVGSDSGGLIEASASLLLYSNKTLLRTGWYGVLVAYVWSFFVAIVSIFVINRTSPVVFRQEQLEADFRFRHAELRRNAEEVALTRGAPFEHRKLTMCLERAVDNMWIVIRRHVFLNMVQYGFGYYISLVMYLALALAIHTYVFESSGVSFSSDMTAGEKAKWISQSGGIFIQLLYSFTMIVQLGTAISSFASNANRLSSFLDALTEISEVPFSGEDDSDIEPLVLGRRLAVSKIIYGDTADGITAQDISVEIEGEVHIGPVSFSIKKGDWVLINGESGSGKTSIIRVLRGLWAPSCGTIQVPLDEDAMMFLPQVPYISPGLFSLRELIMYPNISDKSMEEWSRISLALQEVGWSRGDMRKCIDKREAWSTRLSPGEAQLIGICRVLVKRPCYAVLDEPTSSLDIESERRVMRALKEAGISAVTVAHSESLAALHDRVITMQRC